MGEGVRTGRKRGETKGREQGENGGQREMGKDRKKEYQENW